jgi:hypothetical protein
MLKFCKDCFYLEAYHADVGYPVCRHPENADVVTGAPVPQNAYDMRNVNTGRCGRDPAKLFKDKPRVLS